MAPSTVNGSRPFVRAKFDLFEPSEGLETQPIRCIPDLIQFNARTNPTHTFCLQSHQASRSSDFTFKSINFFELEQAIQRCSQWIVENIEGAFPASAADDGSIKKSQPVALLMESDVGLFIHITALLSMNIPCVLLSMRLTPEAIRHLAKETNASAVLVTSRSQDIAEDALKADLNAGNCQTRVCKSVPFDRFLNAPEPPPEVQATLQTNHLVREDDRNVIILHSSGTTGLPKAIPLAHKNLLGYAACHEFSAEEDESTRGINLSTLPLFHGFGILAPGLALSVGKTVCFPPPTTIPNGTMAVSMIKQLDITSMMTVPVIMEDVTMLQDYDEAARTLSSLEFIAVGGGGLKPHVAQKLHKSGVRILNHFGATELGALAPIFRPDQDYDYRYLRLRSDLGLKLVNLDSSYGERACKIIGYPFGWKSAFELQDQLEFNPLKPQSEVRILGRNDDTIVLATGEKILPNKFERLLEQEPSIKQAVVFGQGQAETGLLVETTSDVTGDEELYIREIWPAIQKANELMDGQGKILSKSAVLVKPQGKDIPLSDKGVPQRKQVYKVFEPEIKDVYSRLDSGVSLGLAMPVDFAHLTDSIREMVQKCLPAHRCSGSWTDDDDFIHLGMDSLQVTKLRRILNASLAQTGKSEYENSTLPADFVYSNPSVSQISAALKSNQQPRTEAQTMEDFARKFAVVPTDLGVRPQGSVVLLTGSTGNLGSHLLEWLSKSYEVKRIICLIRFNGQTGDLTAADILKKRQQDSLSERGIALTKSEWSKVEFLPWEPGNPRFGLGAKEYDYLASVVTDIFHGAWPMDFKRKLSSFAPQIQVVTDFVQLGRDIHRRQAGLRPRVILASSIAAVGMYKPTTAARAVPETPLSDPSTALPMGYAEAKWVCEKVMENAFDFLRSEIQPMVVRIGQLSGSQATGYWSSQEHMAELVKASQTMGQMPDLKGSLSWIPVDIAARTVLDFLVQPFPEHLVLHLENPVRQPWADMCTIIEWQLGITSKRLPFDEWLEKALTSGAAAQNLREFFNDHFLRMSGGSLILGTEAARKVSPTLRSVGGVRMDTAGVYLNSWKKQKLLH